MTARILRIELRRSTAPWIAVFVAGLGAAMLYSTTARRGLWSDLAMQQRAMLALLWPLALGAGAWQAGRERRSRMDELISTTARPRSRRVLPAAAAMAIGAAAGYLGMYAAGTGYVAPVATYFPFGSVPIVAVGVLSMVAAVWLGMAIGARLPSALTAPALVVVAAAALLTAFAYVTRGGESPGTFLFLPILQFTNGFIREFATVTAQAQVAQALWLVALATTGLAVYAAAGRRATVLAVLPAVVGAAVVLPLQPRDLSGAFTYDREAVAMVCTPDTPQVCVTRVHAPALADLRDPARQALAIMSAKLPNAPSRVEEDYRNPVADPDSLPRRADILPVVLGVTGTGRIVDSPRVIVWSLLAGAGTADCRSHLRAVGARDFDRRYTSARLAVAAWLIGEPPPGAQGSGPGGPASDATLPLQTLTTLHSQPADEQLARVVAFREAELTCDGRDRLDILIGPR